MASPLQSPAPLSSPGAAVSVLPGPALSVHLELWLPCCSHSHKVLLFKVIFVQQHSTSSALPAQSLQKQPSLRGEGRHSFPAVGAAKKECGGRRSLGVPGAVGSGAEGALGWGNEGSWWRAQKGKITLKILPYLTKKWYFLFWKWIYLLYKVTIIYIIYSSKY